MKTRRERIAELLHNGDLSPTEISKIMEISVKDVLEDLKHISKSKKFGEMRILPARCLKCGYEFSPEIKIPTKCPNCKSTWIQEPRFILVK